MTDLSNPHVEAPAPAPAPTAEELAAFQAWRAAQAADEGVGATAAPASPEPSPAPAPVAAPAAPAFKVGQLVKTASGYGLVVEAGQTERTGEDGSSQTPAGYKVAALPTYDSRLTAEELGLEAL